MLIQLDLFETKTDMEHLQDEIDALKKSNDKLRKGLFARHGELAKKYLEINDRINVIEINLCKGKYVS